MPLNIKTHVNVLTSQMNRERSHANDATMSLRARMKCTSSFTNSCNGYLMMRSRESWSAFASNIVLAKSWISQGSKVS